MPGRGLGLNHGHELDFCLPRETRWRNAKSERQNEFHLLAATRCVRFIQVNHDPLLRFGMVVHARCFAKAFFLLFRGNPHEIAEKFPLFDRIANVRVTSRAFAPLMACVWTRLPLNSD